MATPQGVASTGSSIAFSAVGPADAEVQLDWEGLTWEDWEEATNIGEFGVSADEATYTPVGTGTKVKVSTIIDNGEVSTEGPFDETDPAISILSTATAARPINPVYVRVTNSKGKVRYFKGNPKQFKEKIGAAGDILMIMANVSVSGDIFYAT